MLKFGGESTYSFLTVGRKPNSPKPKLWIIWRNVDSEYVGMKEISWVVLTLEKTLLMPLNTAEELFLLFLGKENLSRLDNTATDFCVLTLKYEQINKTEIKQTIKIECRKSL